MRSGCSQYHLDKIIFRDLFFLILVILQLKDFKSKIYFIKSLLQQVTVESVLGEGPNRPVPSLLGVRKPSKTIWISWSMVYGALVAVLFKSIRIIYYYSR